MQPSVEIAIENVSFYAHPGRAEMSEIEFLLEVLEGADAKILLDVNNVYVNSVNHGFDAWTFLNAIPAHRVAQLHIAGHFVRPDGLIIDTHAEEVCKEVHALLERVITKVGDVPILLERDGNYPGLSTIIKELKTLEAIRQRGLSARDTAQANLPATNEAPHGGAHDRV